MGHDNRRIRIRHAVWVLVGGVLLTLLVALRPAGGGEGVTATDVSDDHEEPAQVREIEGTDLHEVVLTEEAARRIDVRTDTVANRRSDGKRLLVVPYGALLYDPSGGTWVYVSTGDLTFRRAPVRVHEIVGQQVLLRRGPASGTEVVTVAGAELWGAEFGVGH